MTDDKIKIPGVTFWYDTTISKCPECLSDRIVTDGMLKVCNDCGWKNYEIETMEATND